MVCKLYLKATSIAIGMIARIYDGTVIKTNNHAGPEDKPKIVL